MPKIRCQCDKILSYKPEQAGKTVTCPNCSAELHLPIAAPSQTEQDNPDDLDLLELAPRQDELTLEKFPPGPPETDDGYALATPAESPPRPAPTIAPNAEEPPLRKLPEPAPVPSFWEILPSVFAYPVKGNGGIAIIVGVVFFTVARLVALAVSFFPFIGGIIALIIAIVLLGLFVAYLRDIMLSSSQGEPEAPDWPDLTDYEEDALKPFLFMIALVIVSLGPWIAYRYLVEDENTLLRLALLAGGLFYMPMGLLCIALVNDLAALNPVLVIRAICGAGGKYLVAWILSAVCVAAYIQVGELAARLLTIRFIGAIAQLAITFYFGLVVARVMGLLYYTSREQLDWIAG